MAPSAHEELNQLPKETRDKVEEAADVLAVVFAESTSPHFSAQQIINFISGGIDYRNAGIALRLAAERVVKQK